MCTPGGREAAPLVGPRHPRHSRISTSEHACSPPLLAHAYCCARWVQADRGVACLPHRHDGCVLARPYLCEPLPIHRASFGSPIALLYTTCRRDLLYQEGVQHDMQPEQEYYTRLFHDHDSCGVGFRPSRRVWQHPFPLCLESYRTHPKLFLGI
jgi:hypothetical protein